MGKRKSQKQNIHDRVVEDLVPVYERTYATDKYEVYANPGQKKNKAADSDEYPDVVVVSKTTGRSVHIDEVETDDSVNKGEVSQWVGYGKLGITFDLTVEKGTEDEADKLIKTHKVKVHQLWRWYKKGSSIKFEKVMEY